MTERYLSKTLKDISNYNTEIVEEEAGKGRQTGKNYTGKAAR
jgi:hypothetical protein